MEKFNLDEGKWRTIGGRRVFIREGQSLSDAMKASGKFKSAKKKNEVKDESKSFSREELKEKYGTDNTDIINAGKAKEDRVTLKEDKKEQKTIEDNKSPGQKTADLIKESGIKTFADEIKEQNNWKQEEGGVTTRKTNEGTNYIQGVKKADGSKEYTRTDYDKNGNELSSKTYKSLDEAKNANQSNNKILNKIETISKAEYDKMPNDYKGTLKELVETAEFRGENKQDLIKQYEKMGYDVNKDKTILVNEKGGTVLKPVKISDNNEKYSVDYFKQRGVEIKDKAPEGWQKLEGATTAPNGYEWYSNGKSRFGGEYKNALIKTHDESGKDNNWQEQVKANNAKMEKDLKAYVDKYDPFGKNLMNDNIKDGYYEIFRNNERANAKIKVETPNEKYMNVEAYAGYKDKFNDTWGKDGSSDKVVSAKMYTNDEFMEHLEDANWHSERKQLLEANLTNQELAYIKDRTKVSAWGVENLTGKEQVDKLIKEAKNQNNSISNSLRRKAYQKYLKEHPASKISFEDFKDMRK